MSEPDTFRPRGLCLDLETSREAETHVPSSAPGGPTRGSRCGWVFDEAHGLSQWGHDFRTDYLYVSRFIRERYGEDLPPIACFTATAKPEIITDLDAHFRDALGIEFRQYVGGHERTNLHFEVIPVRKNEKFPLIHSLLERELKDSAGGAVVFVASRKSAEEIAAFLKDMNWDCAHFHSKLDAGLKKDVQQSFIAGQLRVIVATNAFGMGVDKPDVRVVVHAEIPGSLENYLQEAGRAGRDREDSRCILLYDEEDEGISTDQLMLATGLSSEECIPVHRAIGLKIGDALNFVAIEGRRELRDRQGTVVCRLSKKCELPPGEVLEVTVSAIIVGTRRQAGEYESQCRVDEWEVVLGTLSFGQTLIVPIP